ncbi:cyclic nucleotide-binding domain-containing protein [uncultured Rubinisphaera sp.]|uniref:cyclic nucleotide-binding domain-containing protein n=1 Tax=uncultured Rubinisphaera sp. TaxID=1678686 RepID=UPI0030D7A6AA
MADLSEKQISSFARRENELQEYTVEGQIVTLSPADAEKQNDLLNLIIDGNPFQFPRTVMALDAYGSPVYDKNGDVTYRYSTIYDAVDKYYRTQPGDENPIPILCHQQHLKPVAMCRVCMVAVQGPEMERSGEPRRDETGSVIYSSRSTLVPSCHRALDDHLNIHTPRTPHDKFRSQIRRLGGLAVELLMSDQANPQRHLQVEDKQLPELYKLARQVDVPATPRFPRSSSHATRTVDTSSSMIKVDHGACIMCDRCIRGCTDVKHNNVIGRTGSGYQTRISFDLDQPMGDSSCVECGECAISCPTDALTIDEQNIPNIEIGANSNELTIDEIQAHPLLKTVPPKYLSFIKNSFSRKTYRRGDVIFREGEIGQTAFLMESGRFQITALSRQKTLKKHEGSVFSLMTRFRFDMEEGDSTQSHSQKTYNTFTYGGTFSAPPKDVLKVLPDHAFVSVVTKDDHLFGEASCLNNYPRAFTVEAMDDECSVIEIRRNIVLMLMRDRSSRELLEKLYRERALGVDLKKIEYFSSLDEAGQEMRRIERLLKDKVELTKVRPGQTITRQGIESNYLNLVRIGFVRIEKKTASGETYVESYLGPGNHFGDLEMLVDIDSCYDTLNDMQRSTVDQYGRGLNQASYVAMDNVELLRIPKEVFKEIYAQYPTIAQAMRKLAKENLDKIRVMQPTDSGAMKNFLDQGLANAQNLLVIDLLKCTRCDECTKACSDAHLGTTRLIREGLRFDKYLVTSSCRSCRDPYCMLGCPVDAIHRGPDFNMKIESWCIGCGLCEEHCPYGNINMQPLPEKKTWWGGQSKGPIEAGADGRAVIKVQATICDLCTETSSKQPSCVYACPHDAAHRMSGEKLLNLVDLESRN